MDEFCPFMGHIVGVEIFFIQKMREVSASAFEKECIECLAGDARDPAEVEAELDEAKGIQSFFGLQLIRMDE